MSLQIIQAKPNPTGKDKTPSGVAKPEQLLGEWVDIKNVGSELIRFSTIQVFHTLYDQRCQTTGQPERYWGGGGTDTLKPGQVLRVHTGKEQDRHLIAPADQASTDWHGYAERGNFVLNNRCGDRIIISWQNSQGQSFQDAASYAPDPPEGAILKRVGNQLIVAGIGVRR